MQKTPEAKSYSLYDSLSLYATRLKGFPVKIGGLGGALKATQAVFFRSLTVRPMLIIRNFPQRIVTTVNKTFVMDPNYWGKNFKFDKLPEEVQRYFNTLGPNELEMIKNQYLELQSNFKWDKTPVIGQVWRIAGEVGESSAMSDSFVQRTDSKVVRRRDMVQDRRYY
ncbi:MAG: hypothetical protein MZV63_15520 [Marinilabiliales bacterium]|nr:hypothetical protein [Marinilabiliales bacterium]